MSNLGYQTKAQRDESALATWLDRRNFRNHRPSELAAALLAPDGIVARMIADAGWDASYPYRKVKR